MLERCAGVLLSARVDSHPRLSSRPPEGRLIAPRHLSPQGHAPRADPRRMTRFLYTLLLVGLLIAGKPCLWTGSQHRDALPRSLLHYRRPQHSGGPLSARTLSDGAVFGLFDGDRLRVAARPGCREAIGASSRFAAPSLRYGPSGDPPPSTRHSAAMAVSGAFGHWPIISGRSVMALGTGVPVPVPCNA